MQRNFTKRGFTAGYIVGRKPLSADFYNDSYYHKNYLNYESFRGKFIDILHLLKHYSPGTAVLDIGSGLGYLAYWSKKMRFPFQISMCDLSSAAQKISQRSSEKFKICPAQKLDFADETFDAVTMLDVIEHLYPEEAVRSLKEAFRVLKHGGLF